MFQSFTATTRPEDGPPRLHALREVMRAQGLSAYLVPRADAHQGEYVAPCDERLAWLTGFTGSAGFAAVLHDQAGVFIDGRYRLQVRSQCDMDSFTPANWPETKLAEWLCDEMQGGGVVGYDPWLHTGGDITALESALAPAQITLKPVDNLIDAIWADRPPRPDAPARAYPATLAGLTSGEKRAQVAEALTRAGEAAAVLTLPDSINWLLNIRGSDLAHLPVVQAFAVIDAGGRVALFSDPAKFESLGAEPDIRLCHWSDFAQELATLTGPIRVDPATAPHEVSRILTAAGIEIRAGQDPCILPKACKTEAEIAATRAAHIRDGVAMVRFLHWFDETAPEGGLTEIDCVRQLEAFRAESGALEDISFDTIAGAGPNGAIVHYRVTEETNAPLLPGQLFLIDSGGQYLDGTTDITRTLPVGEVGALERECFTQVLQGMIAIHRARFPKGVRGRDLDALARAPLWAAGRDYDHGTGHGVGVFLSVHEGPQRLSRISDQMLEPGMILSNEPGYYREGGFGIRIENLIVVRDAAPLEGGDAREMRDFETLSFVPIDRRLIATERLSPAERVWIDAYHAETAAKLRDHLSGATAEWLRQATAPL